MTEYSLDEIERAIGDYPRRPVPVDYDYAPIEQPLSEVVVTQVTTSADVVSIEPMIGIDAVDLLELDLPPLRWIVARPAARRHGGTRRAAEDRQELPRLSDRGRGGHRWRAIRPTGRAGGSALPSP
jgi:hypothetical protein